MGIWGSVTLGDFGGGKLVLNIAISVIVNMLIV